MEDMTIEPENLEIEVILCINCKRMIGYKRDGRNYINLKDIKEGNLVGCSTCKNYKNFNGRPKFIKDSPIIKRTLLLKEFVQIKKQIIPDKVMEMSNQREILDKLK